MTRPHTYLIRMLLFLGAVSVVCVLLFPPLREFFAANAALNGLILGVLILGIFYNFRQVLRLYPEVTWIDEFRRSLDEDMLHPSAPNNIDAPKLLAPMATMVSNRNSLSLSAMSMRSLLDGIASRLDESRDLSRYTIGLLIFLGLLGTFWGLLETVASIGDVIGSLSVDGGDPATVFGSLKQGLEAPTITPEMCRDHFSKHRVNAKRVIAGEIRFVDTMQYHFRKQNILSRNNQTGETRINTSAVKQWIQLSKHKMDLIKYYKGPLSKGATGNTKSMTPYSFS